MISTTSEPKCVILGGGGHARVIIDCLRLEGRCEPAMILDADSKLWGSEVDDVPVIGGDDRLAQLRDEGIHHFVVGLGTGSRARLFQMALTAGLQPTTVIHPRAMVSSRARIGAGAQIFAFAVVNPGAVLGTNVIINTAAIVEHDCALGDEVHVACGACLAGRVHVEEGAFIGAGSTVRPKVKIGAHAVVGAGAVVVKDVPPGEVVAGVPARKLQ
jgi:UDP-perosamine 4-acetyltransferase